MHTISISQHSFWHIFRVVSESNQPRQEALLNHALLVQVAVSVTPTKRMRHPQRPSRRQVRCIALMVSASLPTLSSAFVCRPNSGALSPTLSISSAISLPRRTAARTSMLPVNLASLDVLLAESSLAVDIPVLSPTSALEAFAVLTVPLFLFAGLQLTRQDDRKPKNADDPINEMSTNDILTKLFVEVEGKEPTSMFSSSSTASPLMPVKLEARGGAGGGKGSSVLERPPAPSPVDEEVRQTKLRASEEQERAKAAAAAAAVTKRKEEEEKAASAAAAQKAADVKAAQEEEHVRKEMEAKAAAVRAMEEAKAKAEAEVLALKKKQAEELLEIEMRKQRELKMKEETENIRIVLEARVAAVKAKREQEKEKEEKRKLVARAAREAAARKEEEQEKRMIEIRQQQELAKRAERIKLELERAQKEKEEKALRLQQQLMIEAKEKEMPAKKKLRDEEEKKMKATAIAADASAKATAAAAATTTKAAAASKAAVKSKKESGAEWEEMRRLERESQELLSLSPSTLRTGGKAAFSPEGEFIKRGSKISVPAGVELVGAAGAAVGSSVVEKVSKEEVEKERKELLMGLDAVMQDLQRRAEERKGPKLTAKDGKISASASSSSSKKAPAKPPAAAVEASVSDPTAVVKKLTIPKLKDILLVNGVKCSSRAKKEELVRLVVGLVEKNPGVLTAVTTK